MDKVREATDGNGFDVAIEAVGLPLRSRTVLMPLPLAGVLS